MLEKISIIVPVYKVQKYLSAALDSIQNQTYPNWEAICIDDGSPDNCGSILDEYAKKDSRFRIIHQKNGGVSVARNTGLDNLSSHSHYVTFLDSDDLFAPDLFERCISYIRKYQPGILAFKFSYVPEDVSLTNAKSSEKISISESIVSGEKECFYHLWSHSAYISTGACGKLYQTRTIRDIRFLAGIKTGEDSMFNWMTSYNCSKLVQIDYEGYYYRANPASMLHSKHPVAALKGWQMRTKVLYNFYKTAEQKFYKLLPLLGFTHHCCLILLNKLKLRKDANFYSLPFSLDERKWNPFRVVAYALIFNIIRNGLSFALLLATLFKLK